MLRGESTTAIGNKSHSEGVTLPQKGQASHAEGNGTTANSDHAHAEGYEATAQANCRMLRVMILQQVEVNHILKVLVLKAIGGQLMRRKEIRQRQRFIISRRGNYTTVNGTNSHGES